MERKRKQVDGWHKATVSLNAVTMAVWKQPSLAFDRTPARGRFIDYPGREYPSKLLARGSTLTSEEVNEIVSALSKDKEWSGLTARNLRSASDAP